MKKAFFLLFVLFATMGLQAQDVANVKPVKNVILMIPDGCSLATISLSRWYQWYTNPDMPKLNIDPYICGTVRTTCSNAPIGDSAPTTSCYMTGYPSLKGWVSTYPIADKANDIYPMDSTKAYQPLTTVLEASRLLQNKATGLVCTCEFTQATPADCSSHSYNRGKYDWISGQQAHNGIDVLIGGGNKFLSAADEAYLKENGYAVFRNDISAMNNTTDNKFWALYADRGMAYDLDRDASKEPSIAEMTKVAISKLSQNKNGFFLMVEGSEVDFAAHANDPRGMIGDFLAFDKACKVAFDFAKNNGETAVIILSDHGNSGLSIGRRDWHSYSSDSKDKLFSALTKVKMSAERLAWTLMKSPKEDLQKIVKENFGFELTEDEIAQLYSKKGDGTLYGSNLGRKLAGFLTNRTGLAFTTNGHTGEDVLLAAYHPDPMSRPGGMLTNVELNHYLCNVSGFTHDDLDRLTSENFATHQTVFDGLKYSVKEGVLTVKNKKKTLVVTPNTNIVTLNGQPQTLSTVVVYVDKNETFYLPQSLREMLK